MLYTPELLKSLLVDMNYTKVDKSSGCFVTAVTPLANGLQDNPTADTLQKLTVYFQERGYGPTSQSN